MDRDMYPKPTRRTLLTAIAMAGSTVFAGPATASVGSTQSTAGWAYAKHDPANTNYGPDITGPQENETMEPVIDVSGSLDEELVVADGSVYLGYGESIAAYEIRDWSEQWQWETEAVPLSGGPVGHSGQLLYTNLSGTESMVAGLDSESGKQQWQRRDQSRLTVTPTPEESYLSAGTFLSAVDRSGSEQWQRPFEQPIIGAAAAGDRLYVTLRGEIAAVGRDDGAVQWRESIQTFAEPAVANERVFAAGDSVVAFDSADGSELWRTTDLPGVTTIPAVTEQRVYVGAGGDDAEETFFALDAESGEIQWRTRLGSTAVPTSNPATTRPAATGEFVYVGSNKTMHALDAETGEIAWRATVDGMVGPPVPVDGQLLFTTSNDRVLAVRGQRDGGTDEQSGASDNDGTPDQGESNDGTDGDTGDTQSDGEDSDDGSGPGFGLSTGLTALGGVGYLLGRRLRSGREESSRELRKEMDQREE